jgi:hypothetical protein
MGAFEDASSVQREDDGTYLAELNPQWTVGDKPNGGYLIATMARAAIAEVGGDTHPHPVAASAQYLSAPDVGPATIVVEPLRAGRLASQVRARLIQKDNVCVEALFTLSRLASDVEPRFVDAPPPDVTPYEELVSSPIEPPGVGLRIAMLGMVDQRIDHERVVPGSGQILGRLAMADGSAIDPISLLYVADSFPPSTLTLGSVGWVPTLELTVYVRGIPAPGPVKVRQRARLLSGSLVDQVCEVWDGSGQLVAQATQLAAVRLR